MRLSVLLLWLFLLFTPAAYCQSYSLANMPGPSKRGNDSMSDFTIQKKRHCGMTRAGETLMITGGAVVLAGGLLALKEGSNAGAQASSQGDLVGGAVAVLGLG